MFKYPCTGNISIKGFGEYLENEIAEPRRNINLFVKELREKFDLNYTTLVNSGSSANLVAALALKEILQKENKPLTALISAMTFPTTVDALMLAGFDIQVIDTPEEEFNSDIQSIMEVAELPSVVCVTHFLGFPLEIDKISKYVHEKGSYLLQDACETLGLKVNGKEVSNYGDITTYSFYHPHHMSSYGGGAIVCNDLNLYFIIDSISHRGRGCKCHINPAFCKVPAGPNHQFNYERLGINVEMSELNACFGRFQLAKFDDDNNIRKRNYEILFNRLKNIPQIKVWDASQLSTSVFVFPILIKDDRTILDIYNKFLECGVEVRILMGGSLRKQEAFSKIFFTPTPNADKMTSKCFFVGIHQTLTKEKVNDVGYLIKRIIKGDK